MATLDENINVIFPTRYFKAFNDELIKSINEEKNELYFEYKGLVGKGRKSFHNIEFHRSK